MSCGEWVADVYRALAARKLSESNRAPVSIINDGDCGVIFDRYNGGARLSPEECALLRGDDEAIDGNR